MATSPYSEKVLDHFKNPRNTGRIEDADGKGLEGSPACGDMVAVYIKVDAATKVISDIKFESYGCASNIATASIITEMAKGKTIDDAKKITWKQATEELGGLPPVKTHCSVLAVEGLGSAIRDYEEKHGLISAKETTTKETVERRLHHVMNPVLGSDIMRTHLVSNIEITPGAVINISLKITSDNQFANALKEDIEDKLKNLWDIKGVNVIFMA